MIISSSVKKEACIPLQPLTTQFDQEETANVDHVTAQPRVRGQNDTMSQVFGQTRLNTQVNQTLSITLCGSHKTLLSEAFIFNDTVFLSSPFVGPNTGVLNWADNEFQSCITRLIELAEEKTGCSGLIFMLDRRLYNDSLTTVIRAFMYLGFEMIDPSRYGQDPRYILVGYEL